LYGGDIAAFDRGAPEQPRCWAFLALGAIFICNGTLWCLAVAAFSAKTASRFRQSGRAMRWINRVLGGMFITLGVRMAMLQAR
jgi:threonine/homoserine/homoserine lactone efflux protein